MARNKAILIIQIMNFCLFRYSLFKYKHISLRICSNSNVAYEKYWI